MKLVGDDQGIQALKSIKEERPSYLKFLLSEAQSNTNHSAEFKASDGTAYRIRYNSASGDLEVEKLG